MTPAINVRKMSIDEMVAAYTAQFKREQIAAACRKWGSKLWLPEGTALDGARVLWAISGCESSFGEDCAPRHEESYCVGRYSHNAEVKALTAQYGHAAHASFGPWQTLLINVERFGPGSVLLKATEVTPEEMIDCDNAAWRAADFINRNILRREGARTLAEIADAYNSGDWRDRIVPKQYIADCEKFYATVPLPA